MEDQGNSLQSSDVFFNRIKGHTQTILDAIQVGIVVIKEDNRRIVYANPVATGMMGTKLVDLIGQPCWQLFCGQENARCPITKSAKILKTDQVLRMSDGKRIPIVKTVARITLNHEDHLLESFIDVRELKHVQQKLEKANRKLLDHQKKVIEEERLKVLLQMAGVTAHELNQPLTALLGKIELMKMDKDDPGKLTAHLSTLEEAGCRITEIAKRIQGIRLGEIQPFKVHYKDLELGVKLDILLVDDSDHDFERIKQLLSEFEKITWLRARNVMEATDIIERRSIDLIVLEHVFTDGDSLDVINSVKRRNSLAPVVVVTGQGSEIIASQVIQEGAFDYLPKSMVSKESLARMITNALEKSRLRQEIIKARQKIAEMTIRDSLTGLYNRRYFAEALEREVARAMRYRSELVLCLLDIDHFKMVNDTFGNLAGDKVLYELARMLREYMRESDLLCRFGGEEFAILLTNTGLEKAHTVCERFREMVAEGHFVYRGKPIPLTVSIGMAPYKGMAISSPWDLVESADKALYEAKKAGRNGVFASSDKSALSAQSVPTQTVVEASKKEEQATDSQLEQIPIGEILVRAGHITAAQRDQALVYQAEASCRIGEALTILGHTTEEEISWAVANQ